MRVFNFHIILLFVFFCSSVSMGHAATRAEEKLIVQAFDLIDQGQWTMAQSKVQRVSDSSAKDVLAWYAYTRGVKGHSFQEVVRFIKKNPDWPYLDILRLEAEKRINDNVSDINLLGWFAEYAPLTQYGVKRYVAALKARGKKKKAQDVLRKWWKNASLTPEQQRQFYKKYSRDLDRSSHIKRFNHLLYRREYTNALVVADVLKNGYPELAAARRALAEMSGNENERIRAVPQKLQNDAGLLYERLRWRRKNDFDSGAIDILKQAPEASFITNASAWWRERHIIIRRLIEKRQYKTAYYLASNHKQKEGFPLAQAEWVSGWLALNFVNEPWKAFEHFERLYKNVKSPISKSRGAYWAGQASEALKHKDIAHQWYNVAMRYPETFYGQLASSELGQQVSWPPKARLNLSLASKQKFKNNTLVKGAQWFHKAGKKKEASVFLLRLSKNLKSASEFLMAAEVSNQLGLRNVTIKMAQNLRKNTGINQLQYLYPMLVTELKNVRHVEWALVNAIIRQESRFEQKAISHAGARGLMQLMPATAREVASKKRIRHKKDWLTSRPAHNIKLGSGYLEELIQRYGGHYALVAAAYNAGPGRVDRWVNEFGDPRKGEIGLVDWVELIPIYETRNYVQRVLEAVHVYRYRLRSQQKPFTSTTHIIKEK